jgi:hypothetical protein
MLSGLTSRCTRCRARRSRGRGSRARRRAPPPRGDDPRARPSRDGSAEIARAGEQQTERGPVDVLHRDEVAALGLAKSNSCTRFGWFSCAASFASPRNISTNCGSSARWGRMRLMTSSFSKPIGPSVLARNTSAIPPVASFRSSWYFPSLIGRKR